jgi:hypothetical protein
MNDDQLVRKAWTVNVDKVSSARPPVYGVV